MIDRVARRRIVTNIAIVLALTIVVGVVYWPAVHADWIRDDHMVMAFSRMLGTPWPLFVADHFHVPGSHFRPLGYASLWLTQAWFGNGHAADAVVEGAIHVGVVLSLYRLMRVGVPRGLALFCALLYGVHPAVIGAAIWYSDRFGHLSTLFALIAARAAYDYRDRVRGALIVVVLATLSAALAKELGLVVVVPITILWSRAMRGHPLWRGLAWVWGTAVAFLLWRAAVLGTFGSGATGTADMLPTIAHGIAVWFADVPGYATFWPRLGTTQRWLAGTSALLLMVLVWAGLRRSRTVPWRGRQGELLVTGLAVALVPVLVQAPIAALNALPLAADISAVEVAMQARLYYMSFAGIALIVSVFVAAAWQSAGVSGLRTAIGFVLASCVLASAAIGWQTVDAYRARSTAIGQVARDAVAALDAHQLPAQGCTIFFLGIRPPPEWDIYVAMDSVVKALSPDLGKVSRCLVHTDYETFVYFLPAGAAAALDGGPFTTRQSTIGALLPRRVGDVEMVYLQPPPTLSPAEARGSLFLSYENGGFRDVTAEVVSGKREIRLRPVR